MKIDATELKHNELYESLCALPGAEIDDSGLIVEFREPRVTGADRITFELDRRLSGSRLWNESDEFYETMTPAEAIRQAERMIDALSPKRLLLLNAAMLPSVGSFEFRAISADNMKSRYEELTQLGWSVESYIGYPQTAEILSDVLGDAVPVRREKCEMDKGDIALIIKLRYRIQDPAEKAGRQHGCRAEDFEFFELIRTA